MFTQESAQRFIDDLQQKVGERAGSH
jgi:hypothetical protein